MPSRVGTLKVVWFDGPSPSTWAKKSNKTVSLQVLLSREGKSTFPIFDIPLRIELPIPPGYREVQSGETYCLDDLSPYTSHIADGQSRITWMCLWSDAVACFKTNTLRVRNQDDVVTIRNIEKEAQRLADKQLKDATTCLQEPKQ